MASPADKSSELSKVSSKSFYNEYHGHLVPHLETLLPPLRSSAPDGLIWTAGDSSLDNKYWFPETASAVGAYGDVLQPPRSRCDITYWLNRLSEDRKNHQEKTDQKGNNSDGDMEGLNLAAINTSVEATTLNERCFKLRPQDRFCRDNIRSEDILIVSVGGNDVALLPTPCTILSMAGMLCLPGCVVERGCACCSVPVDDCCCGCGASLLSCTCAFPPCLGYFKHMFGTRVKKYIQALTSKTKPRKVLVCMIYYLDENPNSPSWAGGALGALGYNSNPAKLQLFIRKVFKEATSHIQIHGTEVIPVPLFHALDGKNSDDYVSRVEPSASGGRKMAQFLLDIIHNDDQGAETTSLIGSAPTTSLIHDRNID